MIDDLIVQIDVVGPSDSQFVRLALVDHLKLSACCLLLA
jgi:hypothetical protein